MEGLYFHFSLSVCLCVCLCVWLCVRHFLWTKFQPNGCTDLDAVIAKWLLLALAQTLLNLVTLGQRSRSQWRDTHFSSLFSINFPTLYRSFFMFDRNEFWYVALIYIHLVDLCSNFIKFEWEMTSLWRNLSFLKTVVHISNCILSLQSFYLVPICNNVGTFNYQSESDLYRCWRSQVKAKGNKK